MDKPAKRVRPLTPDSGQRVVRMAFTPGTADAFLEQLQRELQKPSVTSVTVDMAPVRYIDPRGLHALLTAGERAQAARKSIALEGVGPAVYKALHLAKLATLFTRVHSC